MKKINIIYWISTGLFIALMLFATIPDIIVTPEAQKFMEETLGYPGYLTRFIGIAKLLGLIGILIPGYPRIREWAYAGLAFDLIGATYSIVSVDTSPKGWGFMMIPIILGTVSYIYYHKKLAGSSNG